MARPPSSREFARLLTIVTAVVTIAVLYLAKPVLVPLALAILFTFLLAPLVTLLERIRLPRVLAIFLVILLAGGVVGAIGWTVTRQLVEVVVHLPVYRSNITDKIAKLHNTKPTSYVRAQRELERLSREIDFSSAGAVEGRSRIRARRPGSSPARPLAVQEVKAKGNNLETLHGVLDTMMSILLVVVFTFFMLLQREGLRNRIIRLSGHGNLNLMTQAMDDASHRVSRYLFMQLLVNACYGTIIFTGLHFIGLPHAVLWASLAGISRFVPYIGAPIAAFLPTVFSLAVFNGWTPTLLVMALFFCMEVTTANFIEPHMYGKHTGLSALAILVAAVFWTLLWGPIGLMLSVPVTVCVVVMSAHVKSLEFLTVLLGDQPVIRPAAHYYQRLLAGDENEASQVLENYLKEKSLEDLYDSVLIPALGMEEQDRRRNALDDSTVGFIMMTTKEIVEDFKSSDKKRQQEEAVAAADPRKILCVPVRDDADELTAIMLAQVLERVGYSAEALPLRSVEEMLTAVSNAQPDVVYLSALPPLAISQAKGFYRRLRTQNPNLSIVIGLWDYTDDPVKAAKEISRGEQDTICTSLAQAVLQANVIAPLLHPEAATESLPESSGAETPAIHV